MAAENSELSHIKEEVSHLLDEGGETYVPAMHRLSDLLTKATGATVLRAMVVPRVDNTDVIHGGLQQERYARRLFTTVYGDRYEAEEADLERDVKLRLAQAELGKVGVREFIVAEQSLRLQPWLKKEPEIMEEQLTYLLEVIAAEVEDEEAARTRIRVMLAEDTSEFPEMTLFYPNGLENADERYGFTYIHKRYHEVGISPHNLPDFETAWKWAWETALPLGESRQIVTHAIERLGWQKAAASSSHSANCVEVYLPTMDRIRDSKNPNPEAILHIGVEGLNGLLHHARKVAV